MKRQCTISVGLFTTRPAAEKAIADLRADGFKDADIGLTWKDRDGETHPAGGSGMTDPEKGASAGGAAGAVAGAAAGAAATAGIITGIIPPLGPVLALGALGVTLINAASAAATAGLAGALLGWGFSEDDAKYYENEVARGNYLVTVNCDSSKRSDVSSRIYSRHGGAYRTPVHMPTLPV